MIRILVVTGVYFPGFKAGGPIRTLANTVEWLGDEYSFRVLTGDRDLHEKKPYRNLPPGIWHAVGKAQVRYLRPGEGRFPSLRRIVADSPHDILYLYSTFSPFTRRLLLARRLRMIPNRPTILAPRGELSSGALGFKRLKKQAYGAWARWAGLFEGVIWQATSALEQEDIHRWLRSAMGGGAVALAPNLPAPADAKRESIGTRSPKLAGMAKVAFLGRISPIKNLHLALEALAGVRGNIEFDIYGPIEDGGYWKRCQGVIASLPVSVHADYRGPLAADQVRKVLSRYHLFLMLSESENFGHAILEALSAGCVVLIGNKTPWQGLAEKKVGWDVPPRDTTQVQSSMQEFLALTENEFARMSIASRELARAFQESAENLNAYRRLFSVDVAAQEGKAPSSDGHYQKGG